MIQQSLVVNDEGTAPHSPILFISFERKGVAMQRVVLFSFFVFSLVINSAGHIFAGTQGGVFRSTNDGDTWVNIGLTGNEIYSLAVNITDDIIFAGTYSGRVFRSVESTTK